MERLNEIMGRTASRRPHNPAQQPDPYQGQDPAAQSLQIESAPQAHSRRRAVERASQPFNSTQQDATYPYGNVTPARSNSQQYNSNAMRNQQQPYAQETPQNRFAGQNNYTRPYTEQDEIRTQGFTRDSYQRNAPSAYMNNGPTSQMNSSDMLYAQNEQYPQQRSQSRQEAYFHHADVNNSISQPAADVLDDEEFEDDEELHMGYGDWEEDNNQTLVYRRSDLEARAQNGRSTGMQDPGYIEQPMRSNPPDRATRNLRDMHVNPGENKGLLPPYGNQQPQARMTPPAQNYASQQVAPSSPLQSTSYTAQGMPMQPGRQGQQRQQGQPKSSQLPHPTIHEQEAPYSHRTTQPLDPQRMTGLNRPREYASPLNRARMRPVEAAQAVPQSQREEVYPVQTQQTQHSQHSPHTPPPQNRPIQPARQVPQTQVMPAIQAVQKQQATPTTNKGICSKCKGAGYLRANVPFGDPNFGKPLPCECKEAERKEKRRQQLRSMSNLDAFRQQTLSTFNSRTPGVQEAYQIAKDFAEDPDGWLVFIGPNGCGKTHLAAAIANQTLDNGAVVLFEAVPDLLDHLRAAFAPTATEVYDQLFSKMREAELLILDDLGSQQSSPWASEKLFQLLNYRYNMGMPTVITANPKGIQGIDERIRSRLSDSALVKTITMDRARDQRPYNTRRY